MATLRLFWKIVALHAVLAGVATAVTLFVLDTHQRVAATTALEERLTDVASVIREQLGPGKPEAAPRGRLQEFVAELDRKTGLHITLVESDGTVLADSRVDPGRLENVRHRPEIFGARESGRGVAVDLDPSNSAKTLFVALRSNKSAAATEIIRVGSSLEGVEAEVRRFRVLLLKTGAAVTLVALASAIALLYRVTRPLETLTRAAQAIASGDNPSLSGITARGELGVLSDAFRAMGRDQAARISELQQKGRQLSESTELLSTVLGGMIEGVVAVDQDERILFANPTARVMLDLPKREAVGRPVWEVVRITSIHQVVRTALQGGENVPVEIELPRSQTIVALLASRLPGNPCPGAVLVMHDVTELRRLENLRREFVSNVSHELKTPLASIQAWTETLIDGAVDDPKYNRDFLQRIAEQADRLHKLILDLLQLARIETGRDVFEVVAVPLEKVIHTCVEAHEPVASAKHVTLRVESPTAKIRVQADAEGLRTILDNLIDNALKYTPDGGSVTVRWRADGNFALLQVEDTGVGIAPEHQARIFERFYRVDKARSREMGGTGLGLSIVKHLTHVFEGRVEVESTPGTGSRFSVWLPLVK